MATGSLVPDPSVQVAAQLRARFTDLQKKMQDMKPIMAELAEIGMSSIDLNFQRGGRVGAGEFGGGAGAWPVSVAASTGKGRVKDTPGATLVDTGILAAAVDYWIDGNTLIFGSNLAYAAIHQFGGTAGKKHATLLPARPYIVLQLEDIDDMLAVVVEYISALMGPGASASPSVA